MPVAFECFFNLLLEFVECWPEICALRRSGFQPCVADELQAALFAAEPVEAELLAILRCAQIRRLRATSACEGLKGGIELLGLIAF